MLWMAYEKEVVLNIRLRIKMCEQEQIFNDNVSNHWDDTAATFRGSHVHLGSRQRGIKVSSYEQALEEELGFHEFGDSLARFI